MVDNSNERTLIIMIGLPGSGKSTVAKELLHIDANLIRFCRDDLRSMIAGSYASYKFAASSEAMLKEFIKSNINTAFQLNKKVLIDECNISVAVRRAWIDDIKNANPNLRIKVIGIFVNTPISVCKERRQQDTKSTCESNSDKINWDTIIDNMCRGFSQPKSCEFDNFIEHVTNKE